MIGLSRRSDAESNSLLGRREELRPPARSRPRGRRAARRRRPCAPRRCRPCSRTRSTRSGSLAITANARMPNTRQPDPPCTARLALVAERRAHRGDHEHRQDHDGRPPRAIAGETHTARQEDRERRTSASWTTTRNPIARAGLRPAPTSRCARWSRIRTVSGCPRRSLPNTTTSPSVSGTATSSRLTSSAPGRSIDGLRPERAHAEQEARRTGCRRRRGRATRVGRCRRGSRTAPRAARPGSWRATPCCANAATADDTGHRRGRDRRHQPVGAPEPRDRHRDRDEEQRPSSPRRPRRHRRRRSAGRSSATASAGDGDDDRGAPTGGDRRSRGAARSRRPRARRARRRARGW